MYGREVAERLFGLTSGIPSLELRADGVYMPQDYADTVAYVADWLRWNPQWVLLESDPQKMELLPIPFSGRQLAAFLLCPAASELMERFGNAGELDVQELANCFASGADGMCKRAIEDAYSHLARAAGSAGPRDSTLFEVAQRLAVECEDKRDKARARLGIASVSAHGLSDAEYSERIKRANDEVASLKCEVSAARKRAETGELDWLRRMVSALYRQDNDWQADATSTDAFLQRLPHDQTGDCTTLDGTPTEPSPALQLASAPVEPPLSTAPGAAIRAKRCTWLDVAGQYIAEVMRAGQYATAKQVFKALEERAGPDSPFDRGSGNNRGSLFVRDIGKPLSLKTVQNQFGTLREMAQKPAS